MTDTATLVSEGERTVIGIELPKGKTQSPTRKVRLEPDEGDEWGPSGWALTKILGSVAIGDRVSYRIVKKVKGDAEFNSFTHIAPVTQGSGERDQMPANSASSSGGHDDVQGGDGGPIPAERDVPNEDTARFESWAFVANVGMVDLAYEELSDALEAGELDSITPELLRAVAQHLLNAADQAQKVLAGRTDRGAQSHTRARGVVRTALRKHPVRLAFQSPVRDDGPGGTEDRLRDIDAWATDIQKTATRLLQLAASL